MENFTKIFKPDKTFRAKKKFEVGTLKYELHKKAMASLNAGLDLKSVVQLPAEEDLNDWLAVHVADFFNRINLIYGTICEYCSKSSCPTMSGGQNSQSRDNIIDDVKRRRYFEKPFQKRRRLEYEEMRSIYNKEMARRIQFLMRTERNLGLCDHQNQIYYFLQMFRDGNRWFDACRGSPVREREFSTADAGKVVIHYNRMAWNGIL